MTPCKDCREAPVVERGRCQPCMRAHRARSMKAYRQRTERKQGTCSKCKRRGMLLVLWRTVCGRCARSKGAAKVNSERLGPAMSSHLAGITLRDKTLRCQQCQQLMEFDYDGMGRVMEKCRCGIRWVAAVRKVG